MSREETLARGVDSSELKLITIALCASAKKHSQSFDALKKAALDHNASRQRQLHLESMAAGSEGLGRPTTSHSREAELEEEKKTTDPLRSERRSESVSSLSGLPHSILGRHLFRFVDLKYDAECHQMLLSKDENTKGLSKPSAASSCGGAELGETDRQTHTVPDGAVAVEDVDIVLHKVGTFGSPSAIRALQRWCHEAQKRRLHRRLVPLVVLDPIERVQLLMTRSMLYKLLDSLGENGQPVALIPRTFLWDVPPPTQRSTIHPTSVVTPLGINSFTVMDDAAQAKVRASGSQAARWWIAKPDEGTGPAFTHHLVMWKSAAAEVTVPPAVQAALPVESRRFVLQELYVYAIPVVLKVYCIGSHVYVRAKPTVNLMSLLLDSSNGILDFDQPVFMDSQDKGLFASEVVSSAPTSRPTLSPCTSAGDYSPSRHPASSAGQFASATGHSRSASAVSTVPATAVPAEMQWTSMVAPSALWEAFLAPDTPAYATLCKLAQRLSSQSGIGLTLYGFDVVLVPHHLAHSYQQSGSKGIGHAEGTTLRYDATSLPRDFLSGRVRSPDLAKPVQKSNSTSREPSLRPPSLTGFLTSVRHPSPCSTPLPSPQTKPAAPQLCSAADLFDLDTGAPKPLLLNSVPIIIDVNYFPGYTGVETASSNMLELAAMTYAIAHNEGGAASWKLHSSSAAREKKPLCTSM